MIAREVEDRFVTALAITESADQPRAWGDDGLACGRWQQHPSFYATWGPPRGWFRKQEKSWDWAYETAVRRFFRAAWSDERIADLIDQVRINKVAMAYHLHGSLVFVGWDEPYAARFARAWGSVSQVQTGAPSV